MTRQRLLDGVRSFAPQRARRQLKRARLTSRQRMPERRLLPDLLIGGMRCGTTSLYKWLSYQRTMSTGPSCWAVGRAGWAHAYYAADPTDE